MSQEPITKCVPGFPGPQSNAHQLQSIISKIALLSNSSDGEDTSERFLDPRSNTTFKFDHLSLVRDTSYLRYCSHWNTYRKLLTRNRMSLIAPLSLFGAFPPASDIVPRTKLPQGGPGGIGPRLSILPLPGWNNIGVLVPGKPHGVHHPDNSQ